MSLTKEFLEVLIIEDNLGDYALLKEYLEERFENLSFHHSLNFKKGEVLLLSELKFDLIFLDLTLPADSGKPLIKKVLDIAGQSPVIILTGSLNLDFCIESLQLGVSDYLFKDELNPNSLFKSINYTIEKQKQRLHITASEKKYSDLFHLSPIAMFVYNTDSFKFLDVNSAALELYGYGKEEFLSMHLQQILFFKEKDAFLGALKEIRHKESYSFKDYFIYKRKSGEEIKAEIIVKNIDFQNQNAMLVVANDITERLNHFEALATQNKKLNEISWQHSHEMRSPASKILGIIELINTDSCSEEEQKFLIKEIENSVKELDKVIRSISKNATQIQPKKTN
ncbi:PAS domain S-box protein [Psychroflexus sediminis]|nr:PAS domain S-box protein [Psychroflexus sediminis]